MNHLEISSETSPAQENIALRKHLSELEQKVLVLLKKVAFFENHPKIADGIRGETLVATLAKNAINMRGNTSYDIQVKNLNLKLEVKFSRITVTKKTKRWTWSKIFGESGNKVYDRLILIGDKDPDHWDKYSDLDSPYILFDIPCDEIIPLLNDGGTANKMIRLQTNPFASRSASSPLYTKYQITSAKLKRRYRFGEEATNAE
jgi:hypothetical protein